MHPPTPSQSCCPLMSRHSFGCTHHVLTMYSFGCTHHVLTVCSSWTPAMCGAGAMALIQAPLSRLASAEGILASPGAREAWLSHVKRQSAVRGVGRGSGVPLRAASLSSRGSKPDRLVRGGRIGQAINRPARGGCIGQAIGPEARSVSEYL